MPILGRRDRSSQLNNKQIKIPEYTWKIAVKVLPGEDITKIPDSRFTAIITPNRAKPGNFPVAENTIAMPDGINIFDNNFLIYKNQWQNWRTWQVDYKEIERLTGYNFFPRHVLSSSLLADSEENSDINSSIINFFSANNKLTTTINEVTKGSSP
ncbi:MAG: DNA/RNA non-specific endonuclease, partial [Waterburya sp.]